MASLTITLNANQTQRVVAAYQAEQEEPVTVDTVKSDLIQFLVRKVHSYETQIAANAAADAVGKMDDPT